MTYLKHLNFGDPKTLTFDQLIQTACELELEINRLNKRLGTERLKNGAGSTTNRASIALENASEHVPHIVEWLTTAKKDYDARSEALSYHHTPIQMRNSQRPR